MLIKFSKQIGKSFLKIINVKVNSKSCQTDLLSFFHKLLLALKANSGFYHTSKMEPFSKIVKNEKPFTISAKTSILDVWQGCEYASELASKLKDVAFLNQFKYQR